MQDPNFADTNSPIPMLFDSELNQLFCDGGCGLFSCQHGLSKNCLKHGGKAINFKRMECDQVKNVIVAALVPLARQRTDSEVIFEDIIGDTLSPPSSPIHFGDETKDYTKVQDEGFELWFDDFMPIKPAPKKRKQKEIKLEIPSVFRNCVKCKLSCKLSQDGKRCCKCE